MSRSVTNWLGQIFYEGSEVYRGARDGNTSSYKVGRITKINPNGTVRVNWLFEPAPGWIRTKTNQPFMRINSHGSPSVDSIVALVEPTLEGMEEIMLDWEVLNGKAP